MPGPGLSSELIVGIGRHTGKSHEGGREMKRLLALTLVILVLTAAPAFAVLRDLPGDVKERLHDLALEKYPGLQVTESWVQDFVALGRDVFNIKLEKDGESVLVHVDIPREVILGEAEFQKIVQAEADAQAENPIFSIMSAIDLSVEEDLVRPISKPKTNGGIWAAGGVAVLALSAGVVLFLKRR